MELKITKLKKHALIPKKAHEGDSGLDLHACIDGAMTINPGKQREIPTGIAVEIPKGHEGQIRCRSSLGFKHSCGITHGIGTIDSGYRGELILLIRNFGDRVLQINPNDRLAQLVICPVLDVKVVEVDTLSDSKRGKNGFGSSGTGKKKRLKKGDGNSTND